MRRLCCLTLCLFLLCGPLPALAAQENDLIRVLLTRFGSVNTLDVVFSGSYTCGELAFQRGVSVRLTAGGKGQVLLSYEGVILRHQGALKLVRHQADGENGLRLQGGLNLYTGDLTVSNDGGLLRLILTLPIEEYLLGVLPWEMSSGFPLEALKAQAVAARSYALTRRNAARDYDVVDNTNDQVYAGIGDDAPVIRRAVSGTAGICVYYQGQPVVCYYTASNGGRVETIARAWGRSDEPAGYIVAKADPYDRANDESVVRRASIPRAWTAEALPALDALLLKAAGEKLTPLGYSGQPQDILIREISAVTAQGEDPTAPAALGFTLSVEAVRVAETDEEEISFVTSAAADDQPEQAERSDREPVKLDDPLEVSVPIFPELETALQLGINQKDNELWSVRAEKDAFVIEARRFGHGVGMSQRGAHRMAAVHGWNYRQIMHFYYADVSLRRAPLTAVTPAPRVDALFDATPAPPPTATPRPTLMPLTLKDDGSETRAIVDQVAQDSSLNLRAGPDTGTEIITRLYYGQPLAVLDAVNGWLHVRTDAAEGYVMEKFVSRTD